MTAPPDVKLAELLRELFDAEELYRFLRREYREIGDGLPTNLGLIALASAAAESLARRNLIDDALFDRIRGERPRRLRQVAATARACRQAQVASPGPRRTSMLVMFVAVGGAAGLGVLAYWLVPQGTTRCEATGTCVETPSRVGLAAAVPTNMTCPKGMVLLRDAGQGPLCLDQSEVTREAFCRDAPGAPQCIDSALRELPPTSPITRVHPQEAVAHCGARGLRLPGRDEFVRISHRELGGRSLDHVLAAMNVRGEECDLGARRDPLDFVHVDRHTRMAPVGSYRLAFTSPSGLDDIFGNVREIVRDGDLYFACGSSWRSSQLIDLEPEQCLSEHNRPLVEASNFETVGFRCAGEPSSARPEDLTGRGES